MACNDVKIIYHQSMFRIRSRRFPIFAALIPIAFVLSSGGAAQVVNSQIQTQVQQHFAAAQQAQQQGRLEDAVGEYKEVLRLQPRLPEAQVNLGLVYYAHGEFENSAKAFTAAEKLRPGMRGVDLWLGIDEVRLNHPAQGAVLLREAIRQDPTEKLAQSWLGTALWDEGQMDAALVQLGRATAQFPDDPDLLFARGEAYGKAATQQTEQLLEAASGTALSDLIYGSHYAEERDWIKAEGHFRRAIERDPHSPDARLELAKAFVEQAKLGEAQEQVERAMKLAPRSAAALALSGEILLLTRHQAEGLSRIDMAIAIDPSEALDALGLPEENEIPREKADAALLPLCSEATQRLEADRVSSPAQEVALAALYSRAGDQSAAMQAYQRIATVRTSIGSTASLLAQAMIALHQHRYDDAEPLLLRWLGTHPDDLAARYDLVVARRNISIAEVTRLLAVAPDSYHVHQLLGQLYVSREEDGKALTEYLAVAAALPDLAGVHFWLGHLYWKQGDADHAVEELTRELELSPGHPEAEAELGTVLVAEERAAEAIPYLQSAIRSKPDLWPAYARLGRAYAMQKDYGRAEEVLKRGLTHDQDASAHYQLALVLRAEGKAEQAAQAFDAVRAIKRENNAVPSAEDAAHEGAPSGGGKQ